MKSLIEFILIHLVQNPEAAFVEVSQEGNSDIYILHVAPEDTGRVIGRNGRIIHAIRTLAKVRAVKEQRHVIIRMAESEELIPQE